MVREEGGRRVAFLLKERHKLVPKIKVVLPLRLSGFNTTPPPPPRRTRS